MRRKDRVAKFLVGGYECQVVVRARDRRGGIAKAPWAREASLLMFVGESKQHPEHLLATSDRSFKGTSNGRAITDYSAMM